jgi:predicted transcriptional regulator
MILHFLISHSSPDRAQSVYRLDIHRILWYLDTKIPKRGDAMKAMTLRLNETDYERLRTVAFVEDRAVSDVIREAIREYIQRKASQDEFRASLERAMQENVQLIAELAKY